MGQYILRSSSVSFRVTLFRPPLPVANRESAEIRIASDNGVAKFVQAHQNAWARRGLSHCAQKKNGPKDGPEMGETLGKLFGKQSHILMGLILKNFYEK